MKIIVVGLGSMGKRRIRILKDMSCKHIVIGIDAKAERRKEAQETYGITTYESIESAVENKQDIDVAFVCTSPLSHKEIIRNCLEYGWNVFTELNLVTDGYKENMKLAKEKKCVLFLSSTFLYREEIMFIRKITAGKRKMNYIYHIGQFLPDWHPWENYNDFFVGDRRTNGCREILAIELPWLQETFGNIRDFYAITDKMSELKINYCDNYMLVIQHEDGNKGILVVDVVSPKAVRNLEIYSENMHISWDGTPMGLKYFDCTEKKDVEVKLYENVEHIEGYSSFVIENAYLNEIQEFFNVVEGIQSEQYGFEKDQKILELIDKIEDEKCEY